VILSSTVINLVGMRIAYNAATKAMLIFEANLLKSYLKTEKGRYSLHRTYKVTENEGLMSRMQTFLEVFKYG
jgi:hypothetical protein